MKVVNETQDKKSNRKEKSLRHVAMVARFLDDNKPKMWIRSV